MLNQVNLAGNLTRDPQVRFFENEKCVADFGIAINRKYKDGKGEMKEETTFVDVECWGRTAELVGQYLTSGRNCLIEGSLKLDQWEDKATGAKRTKIKVNAHRVHFIGGPKDGQDGPDKLAPNEFRGTGDASLAAADTPVAPANPDDSDPPF